MTISVYPAPEQKVILREHNEVHIGATYRYADAVTIGSAATQDYVISTPDTNPRAHFTLRLDGTAVTQFQVFEGATATGGSAQTTWNANRNSVNTSTTTVTKGPTVSGTGTQLWVYSGGTSQGSSKSDAAAEFSAEWILKTNTKYLVRFTSGTAGNLCNIQLDWYESTYP